MPKEKPGIDRLVTELGGPKVWDTDRSSKIILCKFCGVSFPTDRKFLAKQHLNTEKHARHVRLSEKGEGKKQMCLFGQTSTALSGTINEFNRDLAKAFAAANIPMEKVSNPILYQFLEKYTKRVIPVPSTLRRHIEIESVNVFKNIKSLICKQNIYLTVDETKDVCGRAVCVILVGILDGKTNSKPFLLDVIDIQKTNNKTVTQFIVNALAKLYDGEIAYDRLRLFVTDGASYMLKSGRDVKLLFPNALHITCLAHGIMRVAELVRANHKLVDEFVLNMKKIFVKCSRRKIDFQNETGLPLPPLPTITRWNTWLNACFYYAKNFLKVKAFVLALETESQAIERVQELVVKDEVHQRLVFIEANFTCLTHSITRLESRQTLVDAMKVLSELQEGLTVENYSAKLALTMSKNPDFDKLQKYSKILNGKFGEDLGDPSDAKIFMYAPIVSVEAERFFSTYKNLLSPLRQSMTEENIRNHLMVLWNADLQV